MLDSFSLPVVVGDIVWFVNVVVEIGKKQTKAGRRRGTG